MAVLDPINRFRVGNQLMRDRRSSPTVTKPELRAALDATDDWIETNGAAYNLALPIAFRTKATLQEKTLLFCYVAMRRAGLLRAQED